MNAPLLVVLAAACLFMAWGLLCLSSDRALADLGRRIQGRWPRVLSPLLALAAQACCWLADGGGTGCLLWVALACATAFAVAGLMTLLRKG